MKLEIDFTSPLERSLVRTMLKFFDDVDSAGEAPAAPAPTPAATNVTPMPVPQPQPAAAAPAPAPQVAPAPAPQPQPAPQMAAPNGADPTELRKQLTDITRALGARGPEVGPLIMAHGVSKASELSVEQLQQVVAQAQGLLA